MSLASYLTKIFDLWIVSPTPRFLLYSLWMEKQYWPSVDYNQNDLRNNHGRQEHLWNSISLIEWTLNHKEAHRQDVCVVSLQRNLPDVDQFGSKHCATIILKESRWDGCFESPVSWTFFLCKEPLLLDKLRRHRTRFQSKTCWITRMAVDKCSRQKCSTREMICWTPIFMIGFPWW
jgi:hypothetical protein